jgi:hypothetical protein
MSISRGITNDAVRNELWISPYFVIPRSLSRASQFSERADSPPAENEPAKSLKRRL